MLVDDISHKLTGAEETKEYKEFVEKFKPQKTTDDCYTPPEVYDAVLKWAVKKYELSGRRIIRPFYPGGDYEKHEYPEGCVVIDNPPFSILSKILDFYLKNNIDFFLFAPTLTLFSTVANREVNALPMDLKIRYENGAKVNTSFLTNLGKYKIYFSAKLYDCVNKAHEKTLQEKTKQSLKYDYPVEVITSTRVAKLNKGRSFALKKHEVHFVRALDEQKKVKKSIFGGGFLISKEAAYKLEKAKKVEDEKDYIWELSEREKKIVSELGVLHDEK